MKGNRERERYTQLNSEFQRIARSDRKAFLNEQCKEIEVNKRMGKTRNLVKRNWRYQGNISFNDGHNWEDPEGSGREGGGRGDWDGEYMYIQG